MEDAESGLVKRIVHTSLDVENPMVAWKVDSPEIMNGRESEAEWVEKDGQSMREVNIQEEVPSWKEQLTFRGLLMSLLIRTLFSIIVMNLNLTTRIDPRMNVSAGLLGFVLIKTWTKIVEKVGLLKTPFTKQENTVIQTCVVAFYSIAYGGGFGTYLLGMNRKMYKQVGINNVGNTPDTVKEPGIGWMIGFLFFVSFVGILVLVPLQKVLIVDYKLTYPSGTAIAVLINGFHAPHKQKLARFYFKFSLTYVGAGMIFPHLVNVSMLLGGILSWGIMWPLISKREGDWYPNNIHESNMKGINGYRVFVCVVILLGDGLYNFMKILWFIGSNVYIKWKKRVNEKNGIHELDGGTITKEEERQNEIFVNDTIPIWIAASGYVALVALSVGVIPQMFDHVKWYYIFIAYLFAPVLAFCNAYGTGLTDLNLAYNYGKVALFVFAAWAGEEHGGVLVSLALCGTVKSVIQTAADLMQDFKTGHLTLSSPRSMFVSQLIGNLMGCIIAPLTFWLFYQAFDVGNPEGQYKAPYALIYRNMAILGVEGFSALPTHCLDICFGAFFAIVVNALGDLSSKRVSQYIPLPMAMAIPFYAGPYWTIDMCMGSAIVLAWQKLDRTRADDFIPVMASGFICGEGVWIVPSAILALTKVAPPICMKFLSRPINQRVDNLLRST